MAAVPAVLQFVGMLAMPETPVFLYKEGKREEGDKVLRDLYIHEAVEQQKKALEHEVESIKLEGRDPFFTRIRQLFRVYGTCILLGGGL